LKKILDSARPGRPSENVPPPGQAAQNQQPAAPQENSGFAQPQQSDQTAQLRMPPQTRLQPDFNARMTPGSMIDQAERSVAESAGTTAVPDKRAITAARGVAGRGRWIRRKS